MYLKSLQNLPKKHLHIISFDVPFPADYGGVIDVFYKLKAFASEGVKIHLYGKKNTKAFRKMGHVNVLATTIEAAKEKADIVKQILKVKS